MSHLGCTFVKGRVATETGFSVRSAAANAVRTSAACCSVEGEKPNEEVPCGVACRGPDSDRHWLDHEPVGSANGFGQYNRSELADAGSDRAGATSTYLGDGTLTITGTPSSITDSTVVTASGTITVAQRSIVEAVPMTREEWFSFWRCWVAANWRSPRWTRLLTSRGTRWSSDRGPRRLPGPTPYPARTNRPPRCPPLRTGSAMARNAALLQRRGKGDQPNARLVTIGGCFPNPQPPGVIGSTFGPLVDGEGIITCGTSESLAEIVALYRGSTHVGTTATGSGGGTFLGINSYYGCSVISGTHAFQTDELWAVNGTVRGGAASHTSNLHCQ